MKMNLHPQRHCFITLFLLALPAVVQAQFTYASYYGAAMITSYSGPGGAVVIPVSTNSFAIEAIAANAFTFCTNLTSITLPNYLVNIEGGAFSDCTSLTNIVFNNNVTTIGEDAFENCASLTSVTIPGSVTNLAGSAFLGCASLTNISVSIGSQWFSTTNGILFDAAQDTLVAYPDGLTNSTYTIPLSVTNIGDYAFSSCSNLTRVFVGGNVTTIGEFAFSECAGLTNVTITNTFNARAWEGPTGIGAAAFSFCSSLTSVSISTNVSLDGLAFAFCTNLTSVDFQGYAPPDDGTAFYGDPDATVYYVPEATGWGPMFDGAPTVCQSPPSDFIYDIFDGSVTIENYDAGYDGPNVVVIPRYIDGYPVTSVGGFGSDSVFGPFVTSVTMPNTVTNIGDAAFNDSTSLSNVVIPNSVISIGPYAFNNCESLTSVTIPDSVTSIEGYAFDHCAGLRNMIIPGTVNSIGLYAFYNCTSLTDIVIPGSVTNFGRGVCYGCTNLISAYFLGNAPPDSGAFDFDPTTVYYLPGTTGWGATFGGASTELWNPQAMALSTVSGQFAFNITGPTNTTIVVQACTNLVNPVWMPVATNTLLGSGASSFSDPQWTNYPNRYYRFAAP